MKRGIYVLPSIVTLGNLASGVVSILFAGDGHFTRAAWAILAGIVMDMLDGRVARWAGASSQFGVELDSLSDLVTFGVAPAVLVYELALEPLGRPGYVIAIFFAMAGALRLARFNVKAQVGEISTHFVGLPVPAAAGILASFVLSYELFDNGDMTRKAIPILMQRMPMFFKAIPIVMLVLSFLMISTVSYSHFKNFKLGRSKTIQSFGFIIAGLLLMFAYPQNTIFILFSFYVLSGLVAYIWRFALARRQRRILLQQNARKGDL